MKIIDFTLTGLREKPRTIRRKSKPKEWCRLHTNSRMIDCVLLDCKVTGKDSVWLKIVATDEDAKFIQSVDVDFMDNS